MTEKMARGMASLLGGEAIGPMPTTRAWGVLAARPDGSVASVEDGGGWVYADRSAYRAYQLEGQGEPLAAEEWGEWDGGEQWARGLSRVLGSEEYCHSGGGIWLVFRPLPDGRFAVIGDESGTVYATREAFESDGQPIAECVCF